MRRMGSLRGRTEIAVEGGNLERALNRLAEAGIRFGGVRTQGVQMSLYVRTGDTQAACRILRRCGCSIEQQTQSGTLLCLRTLAPRRILLAAGIVCLAAVLVSLLFVWQIDLQGCETVPEAEIRAALSECGVRTGAFWPSFVPEQIRAQMLLAVPKLSWMTVNVSGSCARVTVRERMEKPELLDDRAAADIIAAGDGIVEHVRALEGEPVVQPGTTVVSGDTLISARRETVRGEVRYVHARGSVQAQTWETLSLSAPLETGQSIADGRSRTRYALIFGTRRINLYGKSGFFGTDCDKITRVTPLALRGVFSLPVSFVRERLQLYSVRTSARDPEALRAALEEQLLEALRERLGEDGSVVSTEFFSETDSGVMTVTLEAVCRREIGQERPAITGEVTSDGENNRDRQT